MPDKPQRETGRPSISVIIPTFNRSLLVSHAIRSALDQIYAPEEIIVVDDCSSDDTASVMAAYSGSIPLKYILLQKNGGGAVARNAGIRAAGSEYVAFLDSDDEWRTDHLSVLMETATRQSGHFVIASSALKTGKRPRVLPEKRYPQRRSIAEKLHFVLSAELAFQTSTLLMPRETAQQFMFDPHLQRYQDWDLIARLIRSDVTMILLPDPTTIYHPAVAANISSTRVELPSLRFMAKHQGAMSRKTRARFIAVQIMRRRRIGIRIARYLAYALVLGGMGLKEFIYYLRESWRPTSFSEK